MEDGTQPCTAPLEIPDSQEALDSSTDESLVATQIIVDPRRLGHGQSGLSEEDLSDIFCILHPASPAAAQDAERASYLDPSSVMRFGSETKIREKESDRISQGSSRFPCDLVLRLSTTTKDPLAGYVFGRRPQRCDYILQPTGDGRRMSNVHFRIYINSYGTIMLEDQSTNGTALNGNLLRFKEKENGSIYQHTLEQGAVVSIVMSEPDGSADYKWIVRLPVRDEAAEDAYVYKVNAHIARVEELAQLKAATRRHGLGAGIPVDVFPPPSPAAHETPSAQLLTTTREWQGGVKYNRVRKIGKGAFATVYLVTAKFNGVPFAAKEIEKRRFIKNGILDQKIDSEMKIMSKIQHTNIVKFVEHVDWHDHMYIIMEYIPYGDLGTFVNTKGIIGEMQVKDIACQMLDALKYLHGEGITHRDIKPDNILIQNFGPWHVKLTDFGLSKMIDRDGDTFLRTFCGTLLYCAPEVYAEYREYDAKGERVLRNVQKHLLPPQRYGNAVDIWSTAGVLFFATCGSPPYPASSGTTYQYLLNSIMTGPLDIRPLQCVNFSEHGIRFIRSMLHTRPEHRATIDQLENSAWITGAEEDKYTQEDESSSNDMIAAAPEQDWEEDDAHQPVSHSKSQFDGPATQWPSHHGENSSNEDYADFSGLTETQGVAGPSSDSSDQNLQTESSHTFIDHGNKAGGRLFGEVGTFGSSGAIPTQDLELLRPRAHAESTMEDVVMGNAGPEDESQPRVRDFGAVGAAQVAIASSSVNVVSPTGLTGPPLDVPMQGVDPQTTKSSSLEGTEDLVSNLHVSPAANTVHSTTMELRPRIDITQSLRRPRDEADDDPLSVDGQPWVPPGLPPNKKPRTSRMPEVVLPKNLFWGADPATHHYNYPSLTLSEKARFAEYAAQHGQTFTPGQPIFEECMENYRATHDEHAEPDLAMRMHHPEQIKPEHAAIVEFDKRKEASTAATNGPLPSVDGLKIYTKSTRPLLTTPSPTAPSPASTSASGMVSTRQHSPFEADDSYKAGLESHLRKATSVGFAANPSAYSLDTTMKPGKHADNDQFLPPKRILAKLTAVPGSEYPTVILNVTDNVLTWGRGPSNTQVYPDVNHIKVSLNNFKIFLWKQDYYTSMTFDQLKDLDGDQPWKAADGVHEDMAFYISTKATRGIFVNNVHLASCNPRSPMSHSVHWGQLRHGDILRVYSLDATIKHQTFRFECFWGASREPRRDGEPFYTLPQGQHLTDLENHCLLAEECVYNKRKQKALEDQEVQR